MMRKNVSRCASLLGCLLLALVGMGTSCVDSSATDSSTSTDNQEDAIVIASDGHPVGWTEATHSKEATPDYTVVFPQSQVNRLDITISASDWQAMLADMTTNYGAFGSGGTGGAGGQGQGNIPTAPADMTSACQGLQAGTPAPAHSTIRRPRERARQPTMAN